MKWSRSAYVSILSPFNLRKPIVDPERLQRNASACRSPVPGDGTRYLRDELHGGSANARTGRHPCHAAWAHLTEFQQTLALAQLSEDFSPETRSSACVLI
jgi:hypothetical protein